MAAVASRAETVLCTARAGGRREGGRRGRSGEGAGWSRSSGWGAAEGARRGGVRVAWREKRTAADWKAPAALVGCFAQQPMVPPSGYLVRRGKGNPWATAQALGPCRLEERGGARGGAHGGMSRPWAAPLPRGGSQGQGRVEGEGVETGVGRSRVGTGEEGAEQKGALRREVIVWSWAAAAAALLPLAQWGVPSAAAAEGAENAEKTEGREQGRGAPAPPGGTASRAALPASLAVDMTDWQIVFGSGFALRVPPGFEDVLPREEEGVQSTVMMQNKAPKTPFVARYATKGDPSQLISVLVQPAAKIKLSFFEVQDMRDLGTLDDAALLFISPGATILARRSYTATWQSTPHTYYLYEYLSGGTHIAMSVAAANGLVYVMGASAPASLWRSSAAQLRAAAGAFSLLG